MGSLMHKKAIKHQKLVFEAISKSTNFARKDAPGEEGGGAKGVLNADLFTKVGVGGGGGVGCKFKTETRAKRLVNSSRDKMNSRTNYVD